MFLRYPDVRLHPRFGRVGVLLELNRIVRFVWWAHWVQHQKTVRFHEDLFLRCLVGRGDRLLIIAYVLGLV